MTKCGAINRGDALRLIPTHEVRKSPICLSKSIDITLPVWSGMATSIQDIPWDVLSLMASNGTYGQVGIALLLDEYFFPKYLAEFP